MIKIHLMLKINNALKLFMCASIWGVLLFPGICMSNLLEPLLKKKVLNLEKDGNLSFHTTLQLYLIAISVER